MGWSLEEGFDPVYQQVQVSLAEQNSLAIKKTKLRNIAFKLWIYEALDFTGRTVGGSLEGSKQNNT